MSDASNLYTWSLNTHKQQNVISKKEQKAEKNRTKMYNSMPKETQDRGCITILTTDR